MSNPNRAGYPMTDKVWQTSVYDQSHGTKAIYHFRNLADVLKSVAVTWSKEPTAIKKLNMADNSHVWVYENSGVAVEAIQTDITILDNWTHF
jgi:hypothetical protein